MIKYLTFMWVKENYQHMPIKLMKYIDYKLVGHPTSVIKPTCRNNRTPWHQRISPALPVSFKGASIRILSHSLLRPLKDDQTPHPVLHPLGPDSDTCQLWELWLQSRYQTSRITFWPLFQLQKPNFCWQERKVQQAILSKVRSHVS